jgi:Predicted thioesterase
MQHTFMQTLQVTNNHTALTLGSGTLPVLATPALVAFMENTAMQLIDLPEGKTSVGVAIDVKHIKASPVGAEVRCTAEIESQEDRKYTFRITAVDSNDDVVGTAIHERFVVDIERFMNRIT